MRIYYINLDKHTKRRTFMERQFVEHGISAQRVPAVEGVALPSEALGRFKIAHDVRFPMGPGEVGCFLSHVQCWTSLQETGETHALVMEDDVIFGASLARLLDGVDWEGLDADIVKLETNFARTRMEKAPVLEIDGRGIRLLTGKHASTGAYVINRRVIEKLKSYSEQINLPIDQFLFNPDFSVFHEMRVLQFDPAPIVQFSILHPDDTTDEISSTLDSEREVFKRDIEGFFERRLVKPFRKLAKTARRGLRSLGGDQVEKRIKYEP